MNSYIKSTKIQKYFIFLIFGMALGASHSALAFKQRYHEQITEQILKDNGFDVDSADQAGDANWYTDLFEAKIAPAHADDNSFTGASARLVAKRNLIGDALQSCERRKALNAFGQALHTTQDIFSHSNSIDNGHPVSDLLNIIGGTAYCELPFFAPDGLVSGFFDLDGFKSTWPDPVGQCVTSTVGKCCHLTLNKDSPDEANGANHGLALDAASNATQEYLKIVEESIRTRFEEKSTQMLKLFKHKQRTVYFVIDDTGSMSNDIEGIQASANMFLDEILTGDEAPTLGLVSFKDAPFDQGIFCDIEQLRSNINTLVASDGDDCPEASNSAMLAALSHFPLIGSDMQSRGGRLILATDASAGDANLGGLVALFSALKGVSIDAILTGECEPEETSIAGAEASATHSAQFSSNEPSATRTPSASSNQIAATAASDPLTSPFAKDQLRALTQITGGVLFNVERSEVGQVVPTLLELSNPDTAVILSRTINLTNGSPIEFEVPIDETLKTQTNFMVTASQVGGLPVFSLYRPDGSIVLDSDADISRRTLSSVDSYTVTSPVVGNWHARLQGSGTIVFRVFGATHFQLNSVNLQTKEDFKTTRPEVEFVPLTGQPIVGASIVADLRLTTGPQTVFATLRRSDGSLIQELNSLEAIDGVRRYRASLTVPNESFIIEVTGKTPKGAAFVRDVTVPAAPQTVAVELSPSSSTVSPGTNAIINVRVRNVSSADTTFNLKANSSLGWVTSGPGAVTVAANSYSDVNFTIQVPLDTTEGSLNTFSLLVEDTTTPKIRNSASASLFAAGTSNQPPVCTSASAVPSSLFPPANKMKDIVIKGVTDPDGDAINLTVNKITQDEPVGGNDEKTKLCKKLPDGAGMGTSTPSVRATRNEVGDGRIYEITFTASDGRGESCTGTVHVAVPSTPITTAIDSGQKFDSTQCISNQGSQK